MNAHNLQSARSRPAGSRGREILDRITETLLAGFSKENGLEGLEESKRFEHFAAFSVIRRHYSRSFSTDDVVIGGGRDTGIDAVAIIVNNVLVTDVDRVREIAEHNDYLEPVFIFVQADRSAGFDGSKIGNFGYGVADFFSTQPKLPRGPAITSLAEITDTIWASSPTSSVQLVATYTMSPQASGWATNT
jgi:hypothetical protein